jgi:Ca2+-binding RTX toxin-like protein
MLHRLIKRRSSRKQRALASAHTETLEPRILLTGQVEITTTDGFGNPIDLETTPLMNRYLDVLGTDEDDRLVAHFVNNQLTITSLNDDVILPILSESDIDGTVLFQNDGVTHLVMSGRQGNDYLHNMTNLWSRLRGFTKNICVDGDCQPFDGSQKSEDGDDILIGGSNRDLITGGYGNDLIYGGGGNDNIRGQWGDDIVYGGAGDDDIADAYGDNVLHGGAGDDRVSGGLGYNVLTAGTGHNTVRSWTGNAVFVADIGTDLETMAAPILESDVVHILLSDDLFTVSTEVEITHNVLENIDEVVLTGTHGQDVLDASQFSGRLDMQAGKGDDILLGSQGENQLHGNDGNDTIIGGANADTLFGNNGNDTIIGGADADMISGDDGDDVLWGDMGPEAGEPATTDDDNVSADIIRGGAGNDILHGQWGHDELLGDTGKDSLHGGSGRDTLHGGDHNDRLTGGDGHDRIDGGQGTDTIIENVGTQVRLYDTALKSQLANQTTVDWLQSIESATLTGTAAADVIDARPFSGSVHLLGLEGDDRLYGGDANDRLMGGPGDDWLTGGPGNDLLSGAEGWDTIEEDVAIHAVLNDKVLKNNFKPWLTIDWLYSIDQALLTGTNAADVIDAQDFSGEAHLWGLGGDDQLTGGVGRDMLDGGKGDDRLTGGLGADKIIGGYGKDELIENIAQDAQLSNSKLIQIDGDAQTIDTLFSMERANLTGNYRDNMIDASAFSGHGVHIDGRWGNDTIHGSQASDTLVGDLGDDTLIGGDGNDALIGGAGADYLAGGRGADWLQGGSDADRLLGGPDNDWLSGHTGSDMLYGGLGWDSLTGGTQTDRLLVRPGDSVTDLSENDARLHILDSPGFDTSLGSATAGAWTEQQVIQVDHALEILQSRVGGPALLKTPTGGELELHRIGTTDQTLVEVDTPGQLWFPHAVFTGPAARVDAAVFRQIAYGWYDAVGADWQSEFGWTQTPPGGEKSRGNEPQLPPKDIPFLPPGAIIDTSGMSYVQSGDGQWYYPEGMAFADPDGHWNPREDFATAFAAYFLDYSGQPHPLSGWGAQLIPAKTQYLHQWLESAF